MNRISSGILIEHNNKNLSFEQEQVPFQERLFPPGRWVETIACAVRIVKRQADQLLKLEEFQKIRPKIPQHSQGGAYDWRTILALIILAPLIGMRSMNSCLKKLAGDKALQAAFGLDDAPSPQTMSRYKNQIFGEETFELLSLTFLIELQLQGGLDLEDLVADGAPVKAHLNPKRLRPLEELPYDQIRQLFQAEDFTWVENLIPRRRNVKYSIADYLKIFQCGDFLGFYGIEAFLKILRKDPTLQEALGLSAGVPTQAALRYFKGRAHEQLWGQTLRNFPHQDLYTVLDELARQLVSNSQLPPDMFPPDVTTEFDLFNVLKTRPGVIDPTARFGYTVSKSEVYIGYRWLVIGTFWKGIPLTQYLGQPTQGEPYLLLHALKKLHHILNQLDKFKRRLSGRIYLDGGLKDSKLAPYYSLLRLRPCHTAHKNLKSLTPRWTSKRIGSEQLLSRLLEFGGMKNHRGRHIKYIRLKGAIAVAALQLNALCALERNVPDLVCSPTRLFS